MEDKILTLQSFMSMYTPDEVLHLNSHFKKMVIGEDGASYVENENDKNYSSMVELVLKTVVGESASKFLLVTGSASQNLKCVSEDEQGDADILFLSAFPQMTKEDQKQALVPCDEPGFFKIKQLNARQYPFVKRNGIKFLNANSLREFEPVWFAKELQLPLLVVESLDSEYEGAARDKVASSLDWRTSYTNFYKNSHYFLVFARSYDENIVPLLNQNARNQAEKVVQLLLRILSFSSKYGAGQTKLAIDELEKFGPEFENGIVPAFLHILRDRDALTEVFDIQEDAELYIRAHKHFEEIATKEADSLPAGSSGKKRIRGSFDLVPGIKCDGFPLIAEGWQKRVEGRSWPPAQIVTLVISSGFHLVPKVSKKAGSDPSSSFRLAFNTAEKLLALGLTRFQRECFRVFKMYYYEKLKQIPKVLTTYHLKTVFFWILENSDASIWHEENRAYCIVLLLQYLKISLTKEILLHYFIPENNLFQYLDKNELKKVSEALEDVLTDPVSASGETIEKIKRFYANINNSQPDEEEEEFIESFFSKSSVLFEAAIEDLKGSKLQDIEMSDEMQIRFLQVMTDNTKIKVLKFCFDMVLARNFQAKFHGLFSKYAPLPSAMAAILHKMLPVSNEIITEVVLPQAEHKWKMKFKAIESIIETAKHLTYQDLLNFAMMKNVFSSKSKGNKFEMIANSILRLATSHDEL